MPSQIKNRGKRLFSEIVRRKMPRTVGGYLVAVISVLTAADLILAGLPISPVLYRNLVIVLVALIPVIITLSWFYDITTHGIVRTLSREEYSRQATANLRSGSQRTNGTITTDAINSVAILPFVNASKDEEGEYLSDGITETIINKLAKLADVRVIPRATIFRY